MFHWIFTNCMIHCLTVHIQAGEVAETIHVQFSAPELGSRKIHRNVCYFFFWSCFEPNLKTCPYTQAQLWRSRMAAVVSQGKGKRRKETIICFLALKILFSLQLLAITLCWFSLQMYLQAHRLFDEPDNFMDSN